MISLSNDTLNLELKEPGSGYCGARYDWSSFITRITYKDGYECLGIESEDPAIGCGGEGLCGEFGKCAPLGYDDTMVGENFVKVGVGLVERVSPEAYDFATPAPVIPLLWLVEKNESVIFMSCEQEIHNGYGYGLSKRISLADDSLVISYVLKNTGEKPIFTDEYCHNYLNLNSTSIDESYSINVDFDPAISGGAPPLSFDNNTLSFSSTVEDPFYVETKEFKQNASVSWTLQRQDLDFKIKETLDKPLSLFAVYGTSSVLCPELYVNIHCLPGATLSWSRVWEFSS